MKIKLIKKRGRKNQVEKERFEIDSVDTRG